MARKSGFVRRDGRMRRETIWIFADPVENTLGAASTAVLSSSLNAAALALRPFTVIRTRGLFGIRTDVPGTALESQSASYGLAVVSVQAAAIGVTAVPTPETDRGSDLWFVYESLAAFQTFVTGAGYDQNGLVVKEFDSKAMRKVEDGDTIITVAETSSISLGTVVHESFRMLLKLH